MHDYMLSNVFFLESVFIEKMAYEGGLAEFVNGLLSSE